MYISPFISILLASCALTGILSEVSDSTIIQKLNKMMLFEQVSPLSMMLVAASTGKNLYKMPQSLTEDCVRTAQVTVSLFEKPSKFSVTRPIVFEAGSKCAAELRTNTSQSGMELYCQMLNDEFKDKSSDFTDFDQLKAAVVLPNATKDYYMDVQVNESSSEVKVNKSMLQLDDPAFQRFCSANGLLFLGFQQHVESHLVNPVGISTAIQTLANETAYTTAVDSAFDQLLDDYVKELAAVTDVDYARKLFYYNHNPQLLKIDQSFLQNPTLKDEYAKLKKEIVDQLRQTERVRA